MIYLLGDLHGSKIHQETPLAELDVICCSSLIVFLLTQSCLYSILVVLMLPVELILSTTSSTAEQCPGATLRFGLPMAAFFRRIPFGRTQLNRSSCTIFENASNLP
ncbi:hypothetical protein K501DRAFT_267604 [Backusella circina FSU 941]|nr:hypothetical protein K501DRAFT_267604 [Backusella circina FSU 941]